MENLASNLAMNKPAAEILDSAAITSILSESSSGSPPPFSPLLFAVIDFFS